MMRTHERISSREVCLVMALGALVIIGTLVAVQASWSGRRLVLDGIIVVQGRAFAAAEFGLNKIQADGQDAEPANEQRGDVRHTYLIAGQGSAHVRYTPSTTRPSGSSRKAASGWAATDRGRGDQRVNAILRLRIPSVRAKARSRPAANNRYQGSSAVSGTNTPPGWIGCDLTAADILRSSRHPRRTVTIQKPSNRWYPQFSATRSRRFDEHIRYAMKPGTRCSPSGYHFPPAPIRT